MHWVLFDWQVWVLKSIIDVIGHRQSYVRKGTLMITCDDYILGTYVRTYIEEIIRVKYDRSDVM